MHVASTFVQPKCNIPWQLQKIVHGGVTLEDDQTMIEADVTGGVSVVHLAQRFVRPAFSVALCYVAA